MRWDETGSDVRKWGVAVSRGDVDQTRRRKHPWGEARGSSDATNGPVKDLAGCGLRRHQRSSKEASVTRLGRPNRGRYAPGRTA